MERWEGPGAFVALVGAWALVVLVAVLSSWAPG